MPRIACGTWAAAALLLIAAPASAQIPPEQQLPADDIFRRPRADDMASQAFAIDVHPDWPIQVIGTLEQRAMHLGRPRYAVVARNRSDAPVASYTLAAVVVSREGTTRNVQRLTTIRNLKPGQERKQETEIRGALPSISDRVIFLVTEVEPASGERWTLDDEALRTVVKAAVTGR